MTNVEAYDKAMMEALQRLEAVYQEERTATPERLEALSILISTYDAADKDSEFAQRLAGALRPKRNWNNGAFDSIVFAR